MATPSYVPYSQQRPYTSSLANGAPVVDQNTVNQYYQGSPTAQSLAGAPVVPTQQTYNPTPYTDAYQGVDTSGGSLADRYSGQNTGTDLGMKEYLGMGQLAVGAGNLGLGLANYQAQQDQFEQNMAMANKNYEANKTKYNNSLARTEAVNKVYGSPTVATRIG